MSNKISNSTGKTTIIDRFLAGTVLKLMPKIVTPNHITGFRFVTIPFIIYMLVVGDYRLAILLFIISALSDAVDGALARTTNQITDWGKLYDPLADKLLIGSVAAIVVSRYVSSFLAILIITLEMLIVVGAFWRRRYRGRQIEAKKVGKIKMVFQSAGVGFILLFTIFKLPVFLAAGICFLVAGIIFAILSLIVYHSI